MKALLFFISFLISFLSYSQQRIGLDIGTRFNNLNFTVTYQSVIKGNLIYNAGIFYGGMGSSLVLNDSMRLYSGTPIRTPFPDADQPISDSITTYNILDYSQRAKSYGLQFGVGYFYEFNVVHGIKFNLNTRVGFAKQRFAGYYRSLETFDELYARRNFHHWYGTVSAELYHTIRLTGRSTFVYGVKLPYHFTIDDAKFNPNDPKSLLYGFEPALSVGITWVIGECE